MLFDQLESLAYAPTLENPRAGFVRNQHPSLRHADLLTKQAPCLPEPKGSQHRDARARIVAAHSLRRQHPGRVKCASARESTLC